MICRPSGHHQLSAIAQPRPSGGSRPRSPRRRPEAPGWNGVRGDPRRGPRPQWSTLARRAEVPESAFRRRCRQGRRLCHAPPASRPAGRRHTPSRCRSGRAQPAMSFGQGRCPRRSPTLHALAPGQSSSRCEYGRVSPQAVRNPRRSPHRPCRYRRLRQRHGRSRARVAEPARVRPAPPPTRPPAPRSTASPAAVSHSIVRPTRG